MQASRGVQLGHAPLGNVLDFDSQSPLSLISKSFRQDINFTESPLNPFPRSQLGKFNFYLFTILLRKLYTTGMKNQTYLCKTIGNWCGSAPELFGIYKTMSKS